MAGRRILLRKIKPAAARRRVLFTTPALHLVDGDTPDFGAPMSAPVFDVLAKACADAQDAVLTPAGEENARAHRESLAKAADALVMGRPVPAESRWAAWTVFDAKHSK